MATFQFHGVSKSESSSMFGLSLSPGSKKQTRSKSASPSPTRVPTNTVQSGESSRAASTTSVGNVAPKHSRRVSETMALDLGSNTVQIVVGKSLKERRFHVHESLLSSRSEFIKSTMHISWHQGQQSSLAFPDDNPDIFSLYVSYLYSGSLPTRGADEWLKLVRLYVLAEKLRDTQAKNDIIDAMHGFIKEAVPRETPRQSTTEAAGRHPITAASLTELYAGTQRGGLARKLVLDLYADNGTEDWLKDGKAQLPNDFLFDLATTMMRKRPASLFGSMLDRPSSHYHEIADKVVPSPAKKDEAIAGASASLSLRNIDPNYVDDL